MSGDIRTAEDVRYEIALRTVLDHEGGLVDDPADPGGATKFGISLRFLRRLEGDDDGGLGGDIDGDGDVDADDVAALTAADAGALYRARFWDRYRYNELELAVGTKVFDLAVNMGPSAAHRCLQRSVRAALGPRLVEDGVIGPRTRAGVSGIGMGRCLVGLRSEAAGFYRALVAARPERRRFLEGWLNRAYD